MAKTKLYICPKAGKCKHKNCLHKNPHEESDGTWCNCQCTFVHRPSKNIGPCRLATKTKPAKKQKTLEQLLRWARVEMLRIDFLRGGTVEVIDTKTMFCPSVWGKTLLSALRAAYREWERK